MKTFTHASRSTPGKEYTTTIHDDAAVTCTCPGFIYRQKCRHITEARTWNTTMKAMDGTLKDARCNPMLARALPSGKTIEDYTSSAWVLEEKHDGHRLIVDTRGLWPVAYSRGGKDRRLPKHILNTLKFLSKGIYDGELLMPGGTSTDVKALDKQDQLQLMLFDILEVEDSNLRNKPTTWRRRSLEKACTMLEKVRRPNIP
jgi:ATP-dependent DNA ligase